MIWFILVMVAIVIGASVLVGRMLSKPGRPENPDEDPDGRNRRHEQMMALKASGALKHRKSNRN